MKNKNLKDEIERIVKEKLEQMREKLAEAIEQDEVEVDEEEEVCIEPFKLLEPEEELNKLYEEVGNIEEFANYDEVMHPEACPSVEIDEEEIEYIPVDEVELDPEEIEALNKIAKDIRPLEDLLLLPCEVIGKEKLLIDTVNCHIKFIPILNVYVVAPANTEIRKIDLDAETRTDADIQVHLLVYTEMNSMIHVLSDMATLVEAGVISLITIGNEEVLKITPAEYRGIISPVSVDEIKKLCGMKGGCEE